MTTTTTRWATELQAALGTESVLLDPDVTAAYARDQAMLAEAGTPAAVVLPRSTAEVVAVMQVAARHGVPVVPRGAGSGLAGASNAVDGAITLVMTRMDAVLEVAPADRLAVVQPGVVNKALRDAVPGGHLHHRDDLGSAARQDDRRGGAGLGEHGLVTGVGRGHVGVEQDALCAERGLQLGRPPRRGRRHISHGSWRWAGLRRWSDLCQASSR